jgi:hypothetical protein
MAHAVGRRHFKEEARLQSPGSPRAICGARSSTGPGPPPEYTGFPLSANTPTMLPYSFFNLLMPNGNFTYDQV